MSVLLDTSVLVDHLRDDRRATELVASLDPRELIAAATPTRTEILAGARPGETDRIEALFELITWVDVTIDIADAAGRLASQYRRSHGGIDTTDYLIAAAAQSTGARLLTLNVRHFPMFPNLEPAYR